MTTGKSIALIRRTLVGKVISLLLNMLSRLVITFLPRSKRLLISWLQSPSAVNLEPQKIKSDTVSPSISHEVMGPTISSNRITEPGHICQTLFWGAPKSLQMVTAAMKLKDAYPLEEKL